jgi:hypothetical protein
MGEATLLATLDHLATFVGVLKGHVGNLMATHGPSEPSRDWGGAE